MHKSKDRNCTALVAATTAMMFALGIAGANRAHASQPICTNVATSFGNGNPVSAGTDGQVTGTVKQAGAVNGCMGGTAGTPVIVGTMTEKENEINGVGVPCGHGICTGAGGPPDGSVCAASSECNPTAGGHCVKATLSDIGSGTPDSNGQLIVPFDTTGLDNQVVGFESSYVGDSSGFKNNNSPCVDLVIGPGGGSGGGSCPNGEASIAATLASGNGTPPPNDSECWTFRITVNACDTLTGVTAQGGTNGWTSKIGSGSSILSTSKGSAGVRNNNKRNDVILWNIGSMVPGESEHMDVKVCGTTAKMNCPTDPLTEYLTGPWSTTYGHSVNGALTYDKSDYTGRVSIDTTCPGY
ncbi:MAG TPA: hypothetical protein VL393_00440 [Candidatus Binataceae bacterium]|jgi:hypothetical protein|nr:hypothetical protein [Candidatus Binataceae bacterium]